MCPSTFPTETVDNFELAPDADLATQDDKAGPVGTLALWLAGVVVNTLFWVIVLDTLWELLP